MSRNLALFDLDHTLLPLDSDQAWAHFIAKLGVEGAAQHAEDIDAYYRQYVAGTLDMNDYLNYTLAPPARNWMRGMPRS
jgi:phosphoserine phosphatase